MLDIDDCCKSSIVVVLCADMSALVTFGMSVLPRPVWEWRLARFEQMQFRELRTDLGALLVGGARVIGPIWSADSWNPARFGVSVPHWL